MCLFEKKCLLKKGTLDARIQGNPNSRFNAIPKELIAKFRLF